MPKQNNSPATAYIKRKNAISAIWLAPIVALIFGGWLLVNAYLGQGTSITVQFDNARGIVIGKTEVRYKGLTTGVVKDIEVADDLQSVIVTIEIVASASKMLTNNTQFWYVTADISLQGITGLDTLLSGGYINMQPDVNGTGKPRRHFIASQEPPVIDQTTPGLHLTLFAQTLGSITKNAPVMFKQITVGHVSGFRYSKSKESIEVGVFVEPEYTHLVKQNSRFWNASGLSVTGSITSELKLHSESLAAIIAGGIAFDNFEQGNETENVVKQGQQFRLYPDFQSAEMAQQVTLTLSWNAGVNENTPIRVQGITVGKVSEITQLDQQNQQIIAKAQINPKLSPYLTSETQFYLISPSLGLSANSAVDQLLLGTHLSVQLSSVGEKTTSFVVYDQKPPYSYTKPGLHLRLTTDNPGRLTTGTAVYYQQQVVGSVQAVERLNAEQSLIHLHIQEQYQSLVTADSHFWQVGKIKISGGIQGVDIETAPLPAMLNGGIAFDHGDSPQMVNNGDSFRLAKDQQQARQSVLLTLYGDQALDLPINTRLLYQGKLIGSIHQHKQQHGKTVLIAGIYPEYQDILRENTAFGLVNPQLSLAGLTSPQTLFGGRYILVSAGQGKAQREFILTTKPVAKDISAQGLQLKLIADHNQSIIPGSQVSYQGLMVGEVDTVELATTPPVTTEQQITITLTIAPEYVNLIDDNTRFYNSSGLSLRGNLSGISLQTASLDSLIKGGISFYHPEITEQSTQLEKPQVKEGQQFTLFTNIEQAKMAGTAVTIHFNNADGLYPHQAIKYQGQQVGRVERLTLDGSGQGATVFAYLRDSQRFAAKGAKFWLESPKLNLLNSTKFKKLIAGDFINVLPGEGEAITDFIAEDSPPAISSLTYGLNITLSAKQLGSIRVDNPVMYRQVVVGRVIGVDLSEHADRVNIYINIAKRYAPLVTTASKFWNVSGFDIEAGLFSGLEISSDSIESILSGGIAFATPDNVSESQGTLTEQTFILHSKAQKAWLNWAPKINLN